MLRILSGDSVEGDVSLSFILYWLLMRWLEGSLTPHMCLRTLILIHHTRVLQMTWERTNPPYIRPKLWLGRQALVNNCIQHTQKLKHWDVLTSANLIKDVDLFSHPTTMVLMLIQTWVDRQTTAIYRAAKTTTLLLFSVATFSISLHLLLIWMSGSVSHVHELNLNSSAPNHLPSNIV